MNIIKFFVGVSCIMLLAGCVTQQPQSQQFPVRPFTPGKVTLTLKRGITTQEQVEEVFGAPNIVTQKGNGSQVWIYQQNNMTMRKESGGSYMTFILLGGGHSSNTYRQSDRSMTLIIYFNRANIVTDYRSMSTSF